MVDSVRVPKNCPNEYRKMVESGSVPKIIESGEYRENVESVRVPKNCPNEYRKLVESESVPENDRIRASTGKR